jgi:hypothetical protein
MALHNYLIPNRHKEKRYTQKQLYITIVLWALYIVVFAGFLLKNPVIRLLFTLLGLLNIAGPVYQLKIGQYLKPGEKYRVKSVPPQEFLTKVKKEVKHGN